jgi:hypothetical protein
MGISGRANSKPSYVYSDTDCTGQICADAVSVRKREGILETYAKLVILDVTIKRVRYI